MEISLSLTPTIDLIEAVWVTWFLVVCAGAGYNLRSAWGYFVAAMYDAAPTVRFYGGGGLFVAFCLLAASLCGLVAGLVTMLVPSSIQDFGASATTQVLVAIASRVVLILLGFNVGAAVLADAWMRHTIICLARAEPSLPNEAIVAAIAENTELTKEAIKVSTEAGIDSREAAKVANSINTKLLRYGIKAAGEGETDAGVGEPGLPVVPLEAKAVPG